MKTTNPSLISERDISFTIHQLDEFSRPDGAWLQRAVCRVDLGHLATITVTTRDAAIALADLLRTTQKKGKQMKSTSPPLISERDISFAIHQLDEFSRPDGPWLVRDVWRVDVGPMVTMTVTTRAGAIALADLFHDAQSWREYQDELG